MKRETEIEFSNRHAHGVKRKKKHTKTPDPYSTTAASALKVNANLTIWCRLEAGLSQYGKLRDEPFDANMVAASTSVSNKI